MVGNSLLKNPPDFLSVVGAYNSVAEGGVYVGVVCSAADPKLTDWRYWVYKVSNVDGTLSDRADALMDMQNFDPTLDKGILKAKSGYKRIRCLDQPSAPPGRSSLVWNESQVLQSMLGQRLRSLTLKQKEEYDLPEGFESVWIDAKKQRAEIVEWVDCLYSVILGKSDLKGESRVSRITFLPNTTKTDALMAGLGDVEVSPTGQINASPYAIALIFAVGRTEWLAQMGQLPIQRLAKRRPANGGV